MEKEKTFILTSPWFADFITDAFLAKFPSLSLPKGIPVKVATDCPRKEAHIIQDRRYAGVIKWDGRGFLLWTPKTEEEKIK